MRISTSQLYDRTISQILDGQTKLSDIQQQLATGKKILSASDDPVGAAQVIRITEELDQITQYQRNNDLLKNGLEQQEAIMRNINSAVDRGRQLVVQAGSGTLTPDDRAALGLEIKQIRDEVFDLMNSQNANGEYIFAGFQSQSPAFIYDATATGNKYQYQGDDGVNEIQISPTVRLESGDSGKTIFEDVLARLTADVTASTTTSAKLKITQQAAFDQFHGETYDAVTAANNNLRITITGANQVEIRQDPGGANTLLATQNFVPGEPFNYEGIEFTIDGTVGQTVDFSLNQPEKKNFAETLNDIYVALNDETISDTDYGEALNDALVGLDNGLKALADATSGVGGRLNTASSVYESNLDLEIAHKSARASIEEIDYSEAISELSKQETALQAAQATFPRVTSLSLFDYI